MNLYLSTFGDVTGPFPRAELESSFRAGQIRSDAQICVEGTEHWQSIQNLFAIVETGSGSALATVPQQQPQQVHIHNTYIQPKSSGIAILLEILPGAFFQTFGIGNLYAGNIGTGLVLMLTYWASCVVNFFLTIALIGFITWPLTWIAYLIIAIITANNAANRANLYEIQRSNRA